MPDTQHIDLGLLDFVAHLVMSDQNAANLARFELIEFLSNTWMPLETLRCGRQRLNDAGGGGLLTVARKS